MLRFGKQKALLGVLLVLLASGGLPAAKAAAEASPTPTNQTIITGLVGDFPASTPTATATPVNTQEPTQTLAPSQTPSPTEMLTATLAAPGSPAVSETPLPTSTETQTPADTGTAIPPATGTPTPTATVISSQVPTAAPTLASQSAATLSGKVNASKGVTVSLFQNGNQVGAVNARADGSFSLEMPAGSYIVLASAPGFLSAQGFATLANGVSASLPEISLVAGDVDNNGKIEYLDLITLGINYNKSAPLAADLNNDGVINVLDLQILASNYPRSGPTGW